MIIHVISVGEQFKGRASVLDMLILYPDKELNICN